MRDFCIRIIAKLGISKTSSIYKQLERVYQIMLGSPPLYFKSYSQFGEDVVMRSFLDGRKVSYLDIGSGHPVAGSNTYFLYKSGYNGILIDPLKSNAELTKKFRPLDRFILAGVSSRCSTLIFYEFDPYQLSTFDENVYRQRVVEGVPFVRSESIPMITIASLGLTNNPDVQLFLSVDTEGFEMQVLKGFDFSTLTPDVIVIEDWNRSRPTEETEIFSFLTDKGYQWSSRVHFSDIYILNS